MKNIYFVDVTFFPNSLDDVIYKEIDLPIIREDDFFYMHKQGGINKKLILNSKDITTKTILSLHKNWYNGKCEYVIQAGFIYTENTKSILSKKKLLKKLSTKEYTKLLNSYIRQLNRQSSKLETWIQK